MWTTEKRRALAKRAALACALFIGLYLLLLVTWVKASTVYGKVVCWVAANLVATVKGLRVDSISSSGGVVTTTFARYLGQGREMLMDVPMQTSAYAFNTPLTLAIVGTLFPFLKKRGRALAEAVLVLFTIHLLFVFSGQVWHLGHALVSQGLERPGMSEVFYRFLWLFTENMVVRFEPFLVGFYLFCRFRSLRPSQ